MVKPGVYSVGKTNVNLKQGEETVEYVHVQVKPNETKPVSSKRGCTVNRLVGFFLLAAVLTGIAVGVAYAIKWQSPTPEMPDGGDVISPSDRPGDHDGHPGDHSGHHDGHHGDHSGNHDGHHGDHSGDHDGHQGDEEDDDPDHPHGDRHKTTERPPPIDYIGTRPPQHPTKPRPPRTRPPHDATRPPHRPSHRPPHHHPHHPPHGYTRPPYDGHEGRDNHRGDYQPPGDAVPENDREDFDHPKMEHPQAYRGISAWRADQAMKQRKVTEQRMQEMMPIRPAHPMGRSRVEIEEQRLGYDYGHRNRNPQRMN